MLGCASVGVVAGGGAVGGGRPVVFVRGVVEPRLLVREVRYEGAEDRREADLEYIGGGGIEAAVDRWVGQQAAVMLPGRLIDGQVRWGVLVRGVVVQMQRGLSGREDRGGLVVRDGWAELLDEPLERVWLEQDGGLIGEGASGVRLEVGQRANRSGQRWEVGGQETYVLQRGGQGWTVGQAIEYVSVVGGLGLSVGLVPQAVGGMALGSAVGLGGAVGGVLRGLLEGHGLVVQRDMVYEGGVFVERRVVRPAELGRKVGMGWAGGDGRAVGQVVGLDGLRSGGGAVRWVARADGWLVESTFELVHGWDPSLEGGADSLYSKSGSADFALYANVYRHWVLNEDGVFSGEPYLQGERYHLSGLCGGVSVPAEPVRFERCVTLDDSGARRAVVIEVSEDGGGTWSAYPGDVVIGRDRGAVYLDDTDLPAGFLAAAKAGLAKVRVTAGVRCPVAVEVSRWAGNAFMGGGVERVEDVGGAFGFSRVDEGSIHYSDVQSGALAADEKDDTAGMAGWLVGQMRRAERGGKGDGRARLELAGCWPMLRVGDRVVGGGGLGLTAGGRSQGFGVDVVRVVGVRCRWPDGGRGVEAGGRMMTLVDVVY